jgi:hypothetical protein
MFFALIIIYYDIAKTDRGNMPLLIAHGLYE